MATVEGRVDPLVLDLGRYERGLREQGFRLIAGVDEAGRGALAGPLVAAAVILPAEFNLEGINDSKVLTALQRNAAFERIVRHAVARSVCRCTPTRIDRRGLHKTNVWLLRRCITTLPVAPDYVLTDGFPVKRLGIPNLSIKKGDAVTASVAAASIVAKVTRDRMMDRYHRRFPDYGFDHNRGYGTDEHREAIRRHGPSPIHRYSFKGLRTGYYDGDRVEGP
ncbi:MAG TPA: ribonuclease HII [Actinomycetota bacterium]|nr:ribonuclease HII [Actinomycetota bacterium]